MQHCSNSSHSPLLGVLIMIIASIFISYYLTMTIILRRNFTDNRNKVYQSLLMGLWMGLIELLMVGFLMKIWNNMYTMILVLLIIGIIILTILVRTQIGINQQHFLLSMIEHHQMAIDMSNLVKPKTINAELLDLVNSIITTQQDEINQMRNLLN